MTVIDPMCAPEFFFSGIAEAEDIGGGCVRFTMFVNQTIGDRQERVAVAKMVCSKESVAPSLHKVAKAAGLTWVENCPVIMMN